MAKKSFINTLLERRIPQILGSYLVAGTSLILFIEYLVDKYQFPSHYPTLALFALIGILPSVIILSYFHGAPGKDEWTRMERIGIPINVLFIAGILFFGDSLGIWNISKNNIYDNSLDTHLFYIGSPSKWVDVFKEDIDVINFIKDNNGYNMYPLDEDKLDTIRINLESVFLSEFYKQNLEVEMLNSNDEVKFMEAAFNNNNFTNDREIAEATVKQFKESKSVIFLIIYAIKNKENIISSYYVNIKLRVLPGWRTIAGSGLVDKEDFENDIYETSVDYVRSISKNKASGYVTKVDGNIIYINPGGLELRENMNLLGFNVYNLHDKNMDGLTDKDSDWEIQFNDWERATEIIKDSNDYSKSEIDRINQIYTTLSQDTLNKIYRGQYYGENSYSLKVSKVIDNTIIAKLTELSNPWVKIRPYDLIILE